MSRFKFEMNIEPEDIPNLDDSHKRDCADVIKGIVDRVFKYTLIYSGGVMVYFGAYSLFSFIFLMRMGYNLPQLSLIMPVACGLAFILEFIAGTMRRWAILLEMLLCLTAAYTSLSVWQSAWILPFALYGAFLHLKLMGLYPYHEVISEQRGYPEFTPLPTRDDIVFMVNAGKLDPEEKKEAAEEEQAEAVTEEKKEAAEEQAETVSEEKKASPKSNRKRKKKR